MIMFSDIKMWSSLSNKPIMKGEVCYWKGLLMHKSMVVSMAFAYFLGIKMTPQMKKSIHENTCKMVEKYNLTELDPTRYTPISIISYISPRIYENGAILTQIPEWNQSLTHDPKLIYKDLFAEEISEMGITI